MAVVRVDRRPRKPYCGFKKRHRQKTFDENKYYSIVNDGSKYQTPHEVDMAARRESRARWINDKNFFSGFGVASKMPLRQPGGVVASGQYFNHKHEVIHRKDQKSKHVSDDSWKPIADRCRRGASFLVRGPNAKPGLP